MTDSPEIRAAPAVGLPARREPDLAHSAAVVFSGGARLVVIERQGEWARVRMPDGVGGDFWVEDRRLIDPDRPEEMRPPQFVEPPTEHRRLPPVSIAGLPVTIPAPAGRYRSARTHGGIAGALLVGVMLVSAVAFAATLVTIQAFDRAVDAPFPGVILELQTADDRRVVLMRVFVGFLVLSFIALIVWTRRMYRNLRAIGSPVQRYASGWAVGGWFVPILNFWRPKAILNDIWRGTDPSAPATPGERMVLDRRVDPLLDFWWFAWIGSSAASIVGDNFDITTNPRPTLVWVAIFLGAEAVAAAFGLPTVRKMTRRQEKRAAQMLGPHEAAPVSVLAAPPRRGPAAIVKAVAVPALGLAAAVIAYSAWSTRSPVRDVASTIDGGVAVYAGHGVQFEYPAHLPAQESGLLGGEPSPYEGVVFAGDDEFFVSVAWFANLGARSTRRDFETILDGAFADMSAEAGVSVRPGERVDADSDVGRFMYQSWTANLDGDTAFGAIGVSECESLERIALIQVIRSIDADLETVVSDFLTLAASVSC